METVENERRMVKVESDLANIKELLLEIKEDIRAQPYVPRAELIAMLSLRDERINKLEEDKKNSKTVMLSWLAIGVSLIASVATVIALFKK